jgi:hypothetical protein
MKNLLLFAALSVSVALNAQYYYDDIIGTQEINNKMKTFVTANVRSVTATGYDAQGRKSPDFNEWQDVQANHSILKVTTRNGPSVTRTYYQFDDKTRVINARDSSTDVQTITTYSYDAGGSLVNIKTTTNDSLHDFDQTKERQWKYSAEGKPLTMRLIINGTDSMEYKFTIDEHKNVADEMLYHRGGSQNQIYYTYEDSKVYYFYNEQNRLTDITRYNKKIDRLLPDIMFEYDDKNQVIQRITVLSTVRYDTKMPDYLIWRYGFDDKGLRTKEVLYGKEKELKGKIEYSYTFGQ